MRIKSESVIIPCQEKAGLRAWPIGHRNQYLINFISMSILFGFDSASTPQVTLNGTSDKGFVGVGPQKLHKFLQRQRMSEEITLPGQATCIRQKISLLLGLHTFGNDCQPQILRQRDYGSHDGAVIGIGKNVAYK